MTLKLFNFLQNEVNKSYLSNYKELINNSLEEGSFKDSLESILEDRNLSVFSFLNFFNESLIKDKLSLEEVYAYGINLSFPHKFPLDFNKSKAPIYQLFLKTFRELKKIKSLVEDTNFIRTYPLNFLSPYEEGQVENKEYFKFKEKFLENYVYELAYIDMCLTGHNTLDHILAVNYLALYIARQLKNLNLPIDLGTLVGASLGHDIGKYGVLEEDQKRVPYLHYFYTEEWFKRFSMDKIGHIATNHSTWDLELENLPLESLILIYSDFRVKNKSTEAGLAMHIYNLDDSFHIILSKLDNVDEKKEARYKKVYKKLKDFQDFIEDLGVDTSLKGQQEAKNNRIYSLESDPEVIQSLKYLSIDHNIRLMAKLMDTSSFNRILEMARGEDDWRKIRLYLQIFREYSNYLTQSQKITTLHLLSDLLLNKAEDIRKEAAEIIGVLIASYDEEYRKEIPSKAQVEKSTKTSLDLLDDFLYRLINPGHKLEESKSLWLYNLKNIIKSLFESSHRSLHRGYFRVISNYLKRYKALDGLSNFYLLQSLNYIPRDQLLEEDQAHIYKFLLAMLDSKDPNLRLASLDTIRDLIQEPITSYFLDSIRTWIERNLNPASLAGENYLKFKIGQYLELDCKKLNILKANYLMVEEDMSDIFLDNLKTATPWIQKKVNIDILKDQLYISRDKKSLHTAMHLCNLLKVSAIERVRNYAGESLLEIFPLLALEEKNDVAVELLRALEMESLEITKFIPKYLGQILLGLPPKELDEIIDDFELKLKTSSSRVVFLILNTISIAIINYDQGVFNESSLDTRNRLKSLVGLLCVSIASYNLEEQNESFRLISEIIYSLKDRNIENALEVFNFVSRKILSIIDFNKEDDFLFYNNTSSLNNIYKFISEYEDKLNPLSPRAVQKIAFFPGSFDPFSLSHKEIAIEIRNLGFQVFLAVDEFSWSKRTEAHDFRRNIINMSIASEEDIHIFPKEIPINISNPRDLKKLKSLFPEGEVYVVIGSDVLINASAYKGESEILNFPHIIFDRKLGMEDDNDLIKFEKNIKNIKKDIIKLSLAPQYEDISSSKIRASIDGNRDISRLIDPLAQAYIYDYGLYLKAPQYKSLFETKTIDVEVTRNLTRSLEDEIIRSFKGEISQETLKGLRKKLNYRILLIRDSFTRKILGLSSFYWIRQESLYAEFQDENITSYLRSKAQGRIIMISGLLVKNKDKSLIEALINETLSLAINRDYNYCLYNNKLNLSHSKILEDQLLLQGFIKTEYNYNLGPIYMVNMNNPSSLTLDVETTLKPPFNNNRDILGLIDLTRDKLKKAISDLYPGELLLVFNRDMIYSRLIQLITGANNVPSYQEEKRVLGQKMCVPFGSILNSSILPNTVTKTLHTEKIFSPNIKDYRVAASPHYLSIGNQAKVIKSFNRPVILVDDILHKGYRINEVYPKLVEEGVNIDRMIVAILSGRGKEVGHIKGVQVDSAYFIPNLKLWFNESSLYPYLGGDMVAREASPSSLLPSINMILPYVSPSFIKNTSKDALYNFSKTCLLNAYSILQTIEASYQAYNEKSLNLRSLKEVLISPRYPDTRSLKENSLLSPSIGLLDDLEYLERLENIIRR